MAIYLVVPFDRDNQRLEQALQAAAGGQQNVFKLQGGAGFLVQYSGTTQDLSDSAGVTKKGENGTVNGAALVTVMGSYWGFGHQDMWEWIQGRWGK